MNKQSIAFRLSLYVLLTVAVVIAAINYLNYEFSRKLLMQNIEESATNKSGLILDGIEHYVVAIQEICKNVTAQVEYYYNHDDLELFLKGVVEANDVIYSIHAGIYLPDKPPFNAKTLRQDGTVQVFKNEGSACDSIRKSFIFNIDNNIWGKWSEPYYCAQQDSAFLISYFLPIRKKDGSSIGYISCELNLEFLNRLVSGIKLGEHGYTFITTREGLFLTHPRQDWVMSESAKINKESIVAADFVKYADELDQKGSTSGFARSPYLDHQKAWFLGKKILHTNWIVFTVTPSADLFKDLEVLFRRMMVFSIAGLLLILVAVLLLFRKLFNPLVAVIQSIQRFSMGDKVPVSKKNELDLLNESLVELQNQYSSYIKEQSQSRKDRRKYERDIKSAKEIQKAIVPVSNPQFSKNKKVDLYAELMPAESIGGDLYDYFFIDPNHLLFTIGDVSGKGIPAALFMAVAHTLIKSKSTVLSANHIVERVNRELSRQNFNQNFLTLFLGILNIETGELDYCNAAHNYPYIVHEEKKLEILDNTHGLPIGLYANKKYKGDKLTLTPGDTILLYTDGVIDCKDIHEQLYGLDRLNENISNLAELHPKEMVKRIFKSLQLFKGEAKQADDVSLLAIRYLNKE